MPSPTIPSEGERALTPLARRVRYPNPSPTRPPVVSADAALWPSWSTRRVIRPDVTCTGGGDA